MSNRIVEFLLNKEKVSHTERGLRLRAYFTHRLAPYSIIDDKTFLKYMFYQTFNYELNFKNLRTFNEKLQWLKLFDRKPYYTQLADKFAVRKNVSEKVGSEYLNNLIGVYKNADDIKWQSLPNKFILKTTHASGWNIICTDKEKLDIQDASERLNYWLSKNFYKNTRSREWQYKGIEPQIICEEYLNGDDILGLIDYKFYCFLGEPKFLTAGINRFRQHTLSFYDNFWNKQEFFKKNIKPHDQYQKPENFDEMLFLAKELSQNIPFCRVDFYNFNRRVIFGEITFFPGGGFSPFPQQSTI